MALKRNRRYRVNPSIIHNFGETPNKKLLNTKKYVEIQRNCQGGVVDMLKSHYKSGR